MLTLYVILRLTFFDMFISNSSLALLFQITEVSNYHGSYSLLVLTKLSLFNLKYTLLFLHFYCMISLMEKVVRPSSI